MIKAIIFDVDGVLLESAEIKTRAFAELFADYPDKLPELIAYHRKNAGLSRFVKFRYFYQKLLNEPLSARKEAELSQEFSRIVLEKVLRAPLTRGAAEFLRRHGDRYLFFIASGVPEEELRGIIDQRRLGKYFREVHGTPKLKDEIIADILNRYSLKAGEVVYVGDAESDRAAAEKAGIPFVARLNSESPELEKCRWKVNDLTELEAILDNIESYQDRRQKGGDNR
jgi:HAD superfamily hydrolase (TIGR01549 family)